MTSSGSSSDVALTALATKDQKGSQDDWDKYVEFYGMTEEKEEKETRHNFIISFPQS